MDASRDNALRVALKRFKARTRRSATKRQKRATSATPVDANPLTWDEALRRQLRRARRMAAKAPRRLSTTSHDSIDGM